MFIQYICCWWYPHFFKALNPSHKIWQRCFLLLAPSPLLSAQYVSFRDKKTDWGGSEGSLILACILKGGRREEGGGEEKRRRGGGGGEEEKCIFQRRIRKLFFEVVAPTPFGKWIAFKLEEEEKKDFFLNRKIFAYFLGWFRHHQKKTS